MKERLSIIGLGKLGTSMAACFIHKGWNVIGVDVNQDSVNAINHGKSPVYEPFVDDLISINKERIQATTELEFAIFHTNVSFIIVPTPSKEDGSFSTKYVEAVTQEIARILRTKNDYHLIVITSTVLPGDTARIASEMEEISGKRLNKDFGVVYNPDFIALGSIVHDFLNPDMILIGESDLKAGAIIEKIHKKLIDNDSQVYRMSFCNAELSKIALNSYCTMKITFANIIAEICENMPDGDSEIVLKAIGSDTRIGNKYFKGGLGFCGPCFPRDGRAFAKSAEGFGVTHLYGNLTDEINNYHKTDRICNLLLAYLKEKDTDELAILGLSYKDDTPIIEESVSISVMKILSEKRINMTVYDPAAMDNTEEIFKDNEFITFEKSEYSCIKGKKVCFIATPWSQFRKMSLLEMAKCMGDDAIILDAWKVLPRENNDMDIRYLGKNYQTKIEM